MSATEVALQPETKQAVLAYQRDLRRWQAMYSWVLNPYYKADHVWDAMNALGEKLKQESDRLWAMGVDVRQKVR